MGRPLDPTVDHRITLAEGAELTSRYRKSGAATEVRANEHNFIDPVTIEIGKAGLPILEHRIVWQRQS